MDFYDRMREMTNARSPWDLRGRVGYMSLPRHFCYGGWYIEPLSWGIGITCRRSGLWRKNTAWDIYEVSVGPLRFTFGGLFYLPTKE